MISENNNCWINSDIKEIFKVSRVTVKHRNDKFLYLNDLEQMELISFSNKNDNLNIQINFVDMNGESILDISDFRELGYEYLKYTGNGRFIRCTVCNKLVKKKTNNQLYCSECAKSINIKKQRARDKNKKS